MKRKEFVWIIPMPKTMSCEKCGITELAKPWPKGWVQCGQSEKYRTPKGYGKIASWCPKHEPWKP
jgi:hypothetical protein